MIIVDDVWSFASMDEEKNMNHGYYSKKLPDPTQFNQAYLYDIKIVIFYFHHNVHDTSETN